MALHRWVWAALLGGAVAVVAYWRRALTADGAVAATLMGAIVFARGGVPAAGALLAFFVSSSTLSRLGERRKQSLTLAQAKGGPRDAWQVLANGGIATLSIAARRQSAFLGALAAAGADTWATELGLLARQQPRLITTLRCVPPGTSGGITPEGLAASLGGAVLVGFAWSLLGGGEGAVRLAVLGGLGGSLVDSVLGATVQSVYRCSACGATAEQPIHHACEQLAELSSGQAWMTNDTVNALATLAGALIGSVTPSAAGHVRGGS